MTKPANLRTVHAYMEATMIKRLLPLLFILLSTPAYATAYYVCDTTENTGSDSNDGSLSTPWLTMDKALAEIDTLSGGDTLSFCEGFTGSSTADNIIASTGSCSNATPCTINTYTPAGQDAGDDGVKPTLTNTTYDVLKFDGAILEDGGYVFDSLHLIGGSSTDCVNIVDGFSNLTLDTITYDSCAIGVDIEVVADEVSVNVDVIDGTWTDVADFGYRGSASRSVVEGGTMTDVGNSASDHAFLLQGIDTSDFTIRNINITDTAHVSTACSSPVIQGEGSFRGLYFDEVHINETKATAAAECIGILLDPDFGAEAANFNYVLFSKVTVAWPGANAIACSNCTNITGEHNIIIGDATVTDAIKIPYTTETTTSNYASFYKTYIVLIDNDTGRTAINIDTAKGNLTKNQVFLNDTDDVCWNINSTLTLDDNICKNAVVGGLDDSTNWTIN